MARASKIIKVIDDGKSDIFERFEKELDDFLEISTITKIENISYQQFMVASPLTQHPLVQLVAFIIVEYDEGMQRELDKIDEQEVSNLIIE